MLKTFRLRIAMKNRSARLKLAGMLVRGLGCTTLSGDLVLQAVKKLAELDSYIEKSSEIQHRKHAYAQLIERLREIGQMLEGAVRVGDPAQDAQQLIQVYMQARWNSMSRNQQRKYQRAQAAQQMAKLPPRPPKATAVTPDDTASPLQREIDAENAGVVEASGIKKVAVT